MFKKSIKKREMELKSHAKTGFLHFVAFQGRSLPVFFWYFPVPSSQPGRKSCLLSDSDSLAFTAAFTPDLSEGYQECLRGLLPDFFTVVEKPKGKIEVAYK